jgi:hypothetical protein
MGTRKTSAALTSAGLLREVTGLTSMAHTRALYSMLPEMVKSRVNLRVDRRKLKVHLTHIACGQFQEVHIAMKTEDGRSSRQTNAGHDFPIERKELLSTCFITEGLEKYKSLAGRTFILFSEDADLAISATGIVGQDEFMVSISSLSGEQQTEHTMRSKTLDLLGTTCLIRGTIETVGKDDWRLFDIEALDKALGFDSGDTNAPSTATP